MVAANTNTSVDFRRCHPVTAGWEGGWSNNPADPGGKTMYGVTQPTFDSWSDMRGMPRRHIADITRAEAEQLFFDDFWTAARCESLVPGVDLAVYDASVNSGVSRGRKWLLASIGGRDDETVKRICAKRLGFVQSLAIWKTFGKGWSNRIADIQAKGVAWALAASTDTHIVAQQLGDEASAKDAAAGKRVRDAALTTTGGSGAGVAGHSTQVADWLLAGFGALVVVAIGMLIVRAVWNRQQAAAYRREAGAL